MRLQLDGLGGTNNFIHAHGEFARKHIAAYATCQIKTQTERFQTSNSKIQTWILDFANWKSSQEHLTTRQLGKGRSTLSVIFGGNHLPAPWTTDSMFFESAAHSRRVRRDLF